MQRSEKLSSTVLDAASAPVRLQILRLLSTKGALPYTEIMGFLKLDPVRDAGKFVYHLRSLADAELILLDKKSKKYGITELGEKLVEFSRDIEEYLHVKRGKMFVRTSRLAMEEFQRDKIEKSIISEAGVPGDLARLVAGEVEDRLLRLRTTYLTAPLIREFVNTILIEKRLEEYRHKLTRLGMPVHDVTQLLKSVGKTGLPVDTVPRSAGTSVMAEYVLINSLPRDVSDAHISGLIHVSNLDSWILKPDEFQHDASYLFRYGFGSNARPSNLVEALVLLANLFCATCSEVSGEQGVSLFNTLLAPFAKGMSHEEVVKALIPFMMFLQQQGFTSGFKSGLSLQLDLEIPEFVANNEAIGPNGKVSGIYGDYANEARLIVDALLDSTFQLARNAALITPRLIFNLSESSSQDESLASLLRKAHKLILEKRLPYLMLKKSSTKETVTATGARLRDDWSEDWSVDCIRTGCAGSAFINMPRLAYESHSEETKFHELLQTSIRYLIEAFKIKRDSLAERIQQSSLPVLSHPSSDSPYFRLQPASYAVSFLGLFSAVARLVGVDVRKDTSAVQYASKLMRETSDVIASLQEEGEMRLVLAQRPGDEAASRMAQLDMEKYGKGIVVAEGTRTYPFYTDMPAIPLSVKMPLEERFAGEGEVQRYLKGGCLNVVPLSTTMQSESALLEMSRKALENGIGFLTYTSIFTQCLLCGSISLGLLQRCKECSSEKLTHYGRSDATYKPLTIWPEAKRRGLEKRIEYP